MSPLPDTLYPVLGTLPGDMREQLARAAQQITVPAGARVFDERQPCAGFPFVLEGALRVVKRSPQGRELPLYRVLPGETCIVSTGCLLGHVGYNATGVAECETRLLVLPPAVFDRLLAEAPFRDYVFRLFSDRIAELMQLIEAVAFRRLDARLAERLLGHGPVLRITHQQLADELGSVREIVSRLLKGFADEGLVRLGREQIDILDAAGLRQRTV